MKRNVLSTIFAATLALLSAAPANACCLPYIPWLDPFAWLGLYGCGGCCGYGGYGGYGYGCGNGCYGGYGYGMPSYGYGYQAMPMNYPVAPVAPMSPGCNCTGAVAPQAQLTAVQVPVTTYRAVTQYVPQTTYQTQYQYQATSAVAYGGYAAPTTAMMPATTYPTTAALPAPSVYSGGVYNSQFAPAPVYTNPGMYSSPMMGQPSMNVASPMSGDVHGDHEFPPQSAANPPIYLNSAQQTVPVRRVSYGVTPQAPRTYSAVVR